LLAVFARSVKGTPELVARPSHDNGRTWGDVQILTTLPRDDDLDEFNNLFNLPIAGDGTTVGLNRLPIGRWFELEFQWDGDQRQCIVAIDGRQSTTLRQNRESLGACYLRLLSTATATDNSGLMVERVEASVTPGS
jgi:hypothetical protein